MIESMEVGMIDSNVIGNCNSFKCRIIVKSTQHTNSICYIRSSINSHPDIEVTPSLFPEMESSVHTSPDLYTPLTLS